MTDSLDSLRKAVVTEVRKKRRSAEQQVKHEPAKMVGAFIEACLVGLKISREQFALELDIEPLLADALLSGLIPASELDDDFLVEIAAVIAHEPNTLRIFLGRAIEPTNDRSDEDDAARA
jgi:hypothetical protein